MQGTRTRSNGEGSVFQRARDGRYVARYRPAGGRGREWVRSTREEAELELVKHRAALEAGRPEITSRMTVGAWLTRWSGSLTGKSGTLAQYEYNVRRFLIPELGHHKLRDLRRIHVEEALARIGKYRKVQGAGVVGASTVSGARRTLSVALSAAVDNGLASSNAAAGRLRNAPRPVVDKIYPSPEEADRLLEELRGDELYPLFVLARWTGARVGELRGLRPRDIDRRRGIVTIARQVDGAELKTHASRRPMPLPDHVLEILDHVPARSLAYVFTTRTGQPLDNRRLGRVLERAAERAGLPPYTPHSLRHAFAAELLGARLPESYVMTLLGHASITTTVHEYGHLRATRGATRTALSEWWSGRDLAHDADIEHAF